MGEYITLLGCLSHLHDQSYNLRMLPRHVHQLPSQLDPLLSLHPLGIIPRIVYLHTLRSRYCAERSNGHPCSNIRVNSLRSQIQKRFFRFLLKMLG